MPRLNSWAACALPRWRPVAWRHPVWSDNFLPQNISTGYTGGSTGEAWASSETGRARARRTPPCSCGRRLPLIQSIAGRTSDVIVGPSGQVAHGILFSRALAQLNWFGAYSVQ